MVGMEIVLKGIMEAEFKVGNFRYKAASWMPNGQILAIPQHRPDNWSGMSAKEREDWMIKHSFLIKGVGDEKECMIQHMIL